MQQLSAEDFLNKSVKPIIEALAEATITENPSDPVSLKKIN